MRSRLVWMFAMAALVAAPLTGWAQRTTGDIRGVVVDESAGVLPGVTVTLRGPAVQGTPVAVTNELGVYRFPNLAPGIYEITAELPGFSTKTQTGIQVALGATAEVRVQLAVSTQQETITVTAEAPVGRFGHHRSRHQLHARVGRERAGAPLHVLRPDQRRARRGPEHADQLALAGLRVGGQREPVPARRHRLHGAALGRGLAVAQHRRHRRSAGAVARRAGRVRQRRRRGLQHRHPPGQSNQFHGDTNFYYQNSGLTGRNTTDRPGCRSALQPRPLPRLDDAARRAHPEGQAVVLRLVPVPGRLGIAARHAQGVSRPSRTPSATSGS